MKNLFFLVLGLLLLVPITENIEVQFEKADGVVDVTNNGSWAEYFEGSLELFTFDYHQHVLSHHGEDQEVFGKAFIAGGKIITAEHLTVAWNDYMRNDISILGDSPIHGLEICNQDHGLGDKFYYRTRHDGVKNFVVTYESGNNYEARMDKPMRSGESGSPIICEQHKRVVALATAFGITVEGYIIGILTKVPVQQYR